MKHTEYSISNHCIFHQQYINLINAKHALLTDKFMHWCEENEELEQLRSEAEAAVEKYLKAVHSVYYEEERALTEQLCKKKTLF